MDMRLLLPFLEYKLDRVLKMDFKNSSCILLLSLFLLNGGLDPTISVGGIVHEIGGQFRIGNGDYFVVESCEYKNSFLSFFPTDAIILNIDEDHLDFFKDINDKALFCHFGE